jgi:hypothetical protein
MKPYLQKTKRTFYGNEVFIKIKYLKGKLKRRLLNSGYLPNDKELVLDTTLWTRSSIKQQLRKEYETLRYNT